MRSIGPLCLLQSKTTFTWLIISAFYYFTRDSSAEGKFLATKSMHNGTSKKNERSHSRRTVLSMTCYTLPCYTFHRRRNMNFLNTKANDFYFIYLVFYQAHLVKRHAVNAIKRNAFARPAKIFAD